MGPVVLGALVQVAMMWGEVSAQFDQVGFVGVLQDPVRLNGATGIAIAGNYAYVTATWDDGVSVLNITDPSSPTLAGSIWDSDILNDPRGIAVRGDYAYVGDAFGLVSINIADPTNLTIVHKLADTTHFNGLQAVVLDGNHAYVTSEYTSGLVVIDITDPSNLTIAGSFVDTTLLSGVRGIDIVGDLAHLCTQQGRFVIVNISDPRSPSLVGSMMPSASLADAFRTAVAGNYAYVTTYHNSLAVVNITDLTDIVVITVVGNSTTMPVPVGLEIVGNYMYVATHHGIVLLDISDPSNPAIVNEGRIAHDVSDTDTFAYGQDVAVVGNLLYMACQSGFYHRGLAVVDISTPSSLSEVAFFGENPNSFLEDAAGVKVAGNYAYVVGDEGSFTVIDVSNPSQPRLISSIVDPRLDGAEGFAVAGDYAYVASNSNDGFVAVNIADKANVSIAGFLQDAQNEDYFYQGLHGC